MPEVEIITRDEDIAGLREAWNKQAASHLKSLYMTFDWVTSLWESHMAKQNTSFMIVKDGSRIEAIFPLTHQVVKKRYMTFQQYGLVTNNYGRNHNGLILFGNHNTCLERWFDYLDRGPWDIVLLSSIPEDSDTLNWVKQYEQSGRYRLVLERYVASPYLELKWGWEEYLRNQSSNFRSDMKRKWNKAMALHTEFSVYTKPEELNRAMEEIYAIERNSWKEETNTSITTQPMAMQFYNVFLPKAAENGWLYLVILRMEGSPVAYDMGILYADRYYMLKTSYDQRWKGVSPGLALRQFIMQELFKMGVKEHDFLGDDEPWKMRWTQTLRQHWNLYLYNAKRIKPHIYSRIRQLFKQT